MSLLLKRHIYFLFSLIFLCILVLSPFVYSFIQTPKDAVWSPINSQDRLCTDARFYFAGTKARTLDFWTHTNPVTTYNKDFRIDKFKMAGYQLMAILTLGFSDFRIAYVVSFVLSIALGYFLIYLCCIYLDISNIGSVLISWAVIFYSNFFIFYTNGQIKYVMDFIRDSILNVNHTMWFDMVNDSFRYSVLSGSNIFLWICCLWIIIYTSREETKWIWSLPFLVLVAPYTYVSITILMAGSFLGFLILHIHDKRKLQNILRFVVAGIILLAISGFFGDLISIKRDGIGVVGEAHIFGHRQSTWFLNGLKWLIPLLITSFLSIRERVFIRMNASFLICLILVLIFFPILSLENLGERIMFRGGNFLWCFLFFAGLSIAWERRFFKKMQFARILCGFFVFIPSIVLMVNLTETVVENKMFYLDHNRWEAFEYLKNNSSPKEQVFATDFRDIELLPVLTNLRIATPGAEYYVNPAGEIHNYSQGLKFLKLETSFLNTGLDKYFEYEKKFTCLSSRRAAPESLMDSYFLLKQLIFDPYSKFFAGQKIRDSVGQEFSTEFRNAFLRQIDQPRADSWLSQINYWMISSQEYSNFLKKGDENKLKRVFQNNKFVILKKVDDRIN